MLELPQAMLAQLQALQQVRPPEPLLGQLLGQLGQMFLQGLQLAQTLGLPGQMGQTLKLTLAL
jgi:hypothetical protein